MPRIHRATLWTLALAGVLGFAKPDIEPVKVALIAEYASIQPGGTTRVGVLFELEDGWHIYADNPGDAGIPTKVRWIVPREVTVGPLAWPAPKQFDDPGDIKTFGYSGRVVLASELRLTDTAKLDEPISVAAQVEWLACHDICIPGKTELQLRLPVSDAHPSLSGQANLFDRTG